MLKLPLVPQEFRSGQQFLKKQSLVCLENEINILYKYMIKDISNNTKKFCFSEAYPTGIFKLLIILIIKI